MKWSSKVSAPSTWMGLFRGPFSARPMKTAAEVSTPLMGGGWFDLLGFASSSGIYDTSTPGTGRSPPSAFRSRSQYWFYPARPLAKPYLP